MTKNDELIEIAYKDPKKIDLVMAEILDLFLNFSKKDLLELIHKLQKLVIDLECRVDLTSYANVAEAFIELPKGDYFKCIELLQGSLLWVKSEGNLFLESIIYSFQGLSYRSIGESSLALYYYFKSIELVDDNPNLINLKLVNNYQIAETYTDNGDFIGAKKFLLENLKNVEKSNIQNTISFRLYSGLVNICIKEKNALEAKKYLALAEKHHLYSITNTSRYYSDFASYHFLKQEYDRSISFEKRSLELREKEKSYDSISSCHIILGKCYLAKTDTKQAVFHALTAFDLCKKLKTKNKLLRVHKLLSDIYKFNGDHEIAFSHLEKYILLTEEIKIKQAKSNNKLKNKLLLTQKEKLEDAVNELSASIKYAERIQRAMMQPAKKLANLLPESFIFLKPHSIISGDFYWFAEVNNKIIIAAADCTGHGVPAGLLTMKLHGLLTRLIIELKHTVPNEILLNLHQKLHFDLDYNNSLIEDGMDVSIVCINKQIGEMQYAGARRPLVIVDNGKAKLITADRKSIGGRLPKNLAFRNHTLALSNTANYIMYSDGFTDQFGGEKDKKYKTTKFIQLLEANYGKSMIDTATNIEKDFMAWRGAKKRKLTPQTDDVLVIGFKVLK